jgi:hypothetical protein
MTNLLMFATALFLSSPAFAIDVHSAPIAGVFDVRTNHPFLHVAGSSEVVEIKPYDQVVLDDLHKLHAGDYLTGYGEYDSFHRSVNLRTIETVGLKQLLGRWTTRDGQIFDFRDFQTLVHQSSGNIATSTPKSIQQFSYTLAPESKANTWSIYLADKKTLLIGNLEFGDKTVLINLVDPIDGRVLKHLELRPL